MTIPRGGAARSEPRKAKAKKTKVHRHKYQENPRGLFFCRCGRAIGLGFLGQVMLD